MHGSVVSENLNVSVIIYRDRRSQYKVSILCPSHHLSISPNLPGRGINKFSRHCYLDVMDGELEAVAPETQIPVSGVRPHTARDNWDTGPRHPGNTRHESCERWHPGDQYARVVLIAEYKMTKKILMTQKYAIFAKCISLIKSTIKLNESYCSMKED